MTIQHVGTPPTIFHRLRIIASFALLGAVVAGSFEILPTVAALLPAAFDLQAIGAVIGGIVGIVTQTMPQA